MSRIPGVNWAEGMFLRPQHFQYSSRHFTGLIGEVYRSLQPFFWGFERLEVDLEQLEAFTFSLQACDVTFKDGVRASTPRSLEIQPREFKEQLDRSDDGRLPVYLGVARLRDGEKNTAGRETSAGEGDLRYLVSRVEVADENLGGEARMLEVRKLRARFFFGNEDREGYECLPVAVILRGGMGSNTPALDESFVPPVTSIAGWKSLRLQIEGIVHRIEAKHRFLHAEVEEGRIDLDVSGAEVWQPVFKLQIVGAFLHVLRQLVQVSGLHPFPMYLELTRLAGELSIFDPGEQGVDRVPLYDHDTAGECFNKTIFVIEQLLETIMSGRFVKVPFELKGELLVAALKDEWLQPGTEIYLGISSDLSDRAILSRLETAKIGASSDIPLLKQRRLFGLDIDIISRTPSGLPSRENLHYFTIERSGPYWDSVREHLDIAISGAVDPKLRFDLYVILKPRREW